MRQIDKRLSDLERKVGDATPAILVIWDPEAEADKLAEARRRGDLIINMNWGDDYEPEQPINQP